ncbi:MAG: sulfite exporter TauE/SafE family protein [Clostridia bacterium]|nr:sulfite exporter TauE/SafE family protein [Clostridia bacterium]
MNKIKTILFGIAVGTVNALFGAGGGLVAVSAFKSQGLSQRNSQASAIAVILPLCLISSAVYASRGYYSISDALPYLPFGLVGAFLGTRLLRKIPDKALKKIFALFMIYTGFRMLMR